MLERTMWTAVMLMSLALVFWPCALRAEEMEDWYEFRPEEDAGPSVIGMEDWLEPAGSRGAVRMVEDRFEFEDGTPVKFWGVNLGNMDCAPPKEHGARWARWHAKYGVNAVRLHKFIEPGGAGIGHPEDSTRFDPESLDLFDYFIAQLRENGMYYGFSWVFGHQVRPADRDRLIAYDEIVEAGGGTSRVAVFIGEDVQDLRIEMLTNLLKHRNPYTGLTYAEDPALAFIEFHNEDSIFFYTFRGFNDLDSMPTYKRMFNERFSDWLRERHGSHEGLVEAWGEEALNAFEIEDEHLDRGNIMVQGNPWFFGPDGLAHGAEQGLRRRLLDTAEFLFEAQGSFYRRFRDAIRETGYEGPLVGSCWKTPPGLPHYYNLHTDYEVGFIDRHAYFGGGVHAWRPQPGTFNNRSQLDLPGSGILSVGLMQVLNRPFANSEWTTVFPNEWTIESSAIMALYGLGLQGWDASYHFASHTRSYGDNMFASRTCDPRLWVVDIPNQIGIYPALARMVYRGDVEQGEVISTRRVSLEELREGKPDWIHREEVIDTWDFMQYDGPISRAALAAGRVLVDFVDEPAESDVPDLTRFVDGNVIRSNTGQLTWHGDPDEGHRGYITADTPASKVLVGFPPREEVVLGEVTFRTENPFAGLFLTSLGQEEDLSNAESLLLVAMARVRNTGMRFNEAGDELLELGTPPMLIEPVVAEIAIEGRTVRAVRVLDHDGRRTERTLPVADGRFTIDGTRDRAFYYEIELGD